MEGARGEGGKRGKGRETHLRGDGRERDIRFLDGTFVIFSSSSKAKEKKNFPEVPVCFRRVLGELEGWGQWSGSAGGRGGGGRGGVEVLEEPRKGCVRGGGLGLEGRKGCHTRKMVTKISL